MYRFRDCELDGPARELRRAGAVVPLEPQAFDLLVHLVEHRDRVLAKTELLDGVWGHRFVSEAALTTRIKEVRRATGDDGRLQHTVRNVRGFGYRFVADVVVERPRASQPPSNGALIGRGAFLAVLVDLVVSSPMVTLVGPGGVGKSTLARAAVGELAARFPDGVAVVELATLTDGAPVLPAVARSLDAALDRDRPERAIAALARLDALLVLDNCEHVVDDAAALVDRLLAVPDARLRVLATSQVRLGLGVEEVAAVQPLEREAAERLFSARAAAANPAWDLEAVEPARVRAVLDQLDRLPLTIEMAAARLGSMTFADLETAVRDGGRFLQVSHRTPTRRHRSLGSVVAWSADLLAPTERRAFTACSVFAGSVSAVDAAAVVEPDDTDAVPGCLAVLTDRSLLAVDLGGPVARYRMLDTVKVVARRWAHDEGRAPQLARRHAVQSAAWAAAIDRQLRSPGEGDGRRRLDDVVAEIRLGHRWATDHDPDLAADISGALHLAAYSSFWTEPAEWSRDLLDRWPARADALPGARLLVGAHAANVGDLAVARAHAGAVAEQTTDAALLGTALEILSDVAIYDGDLARSTTLNVELHAIGRELGDLHLITVAAVNDALASTFGGDPVAALERLADGDPAGRAPSDRGWLSYSRGEALSLLDPSAAITAYEEAIVLGRSAGNPFIVSVALMSAATEHARAGRHRAALEAYALCLHGHRRHGNLVHAVTTLRSLAETVWAVGDAHGAVVLAAAASRPDLRASHGAEFERLGAVLHEVAGDVGTDRFDAWVAEGRALDLDRAVHVAIDIVDRHRR